MGELLDELENRTETPQLGNDWAPWWDVDDMDPHLVGIIVEIHSAPEQYTDAGEVPDPIYTVLSVGWGDFDAGTALCTKTHTRLRAGLEGATLGDLVNLKYTGLEKTDQGNAANTYEVGIMEESEWRDSDEADEIEEILEAYDGATGDNRRTSPYSGNEGSSSEGSSSNDGEAASFLEELVDMQDGEIDVSRAEDMLNDVRGFDVDVEEVAEEAGLTVEDGVVRE